MVLPPHREGGQAQVIPRPVPPKPGPFSAVLDWARGRPDCAIPIAPFAREAGMSLRSVQRRFREATGLSPAHRLLADHIGRAKELMETTALPVERIATECAFGAADTLRHLFRTRLGTSPRAWRARFRTA
jgi:AraC family transcriptional activator FtrA